GQPSAAIEGDQRPVRDDDIHPGISQQSVELSAGIDGPYHGPDAGVGAAPQHPPAGEVLVDRGPAGAAGPDPADREQLARDQAGEPVREDVSRDYRRWAFESAALDLALRQSAAHATAFNESAGRPYGFWVRANPIEFLFGIGVCQAFLFAGVLFVTLRRNTCGFFPRPRRGRRLRSGATNRRALYRPVRLPLYNSGARHSERLRHAPTGIPNCSC
ncbi:hypothetical protein B4Q13_19180, partial [Lacticaseibacillus rhamnosus]